MIRKAWLFVVWTHNWDEVGSCKYGEIIPLNIRFQPCFLTSRGRKLGLMPPEQMPVPFVAPCDDDYANILINAAKSGYIMKSVLQRLGVSPKEMKMEEIQTSAFPVV